LIRFEMAQFGRAEVPARMPTSVVISLFDNYANFFDEDLLKTLEYRAPLNILDAIRPFCPAGGFIVLDLGCGTGLVGAHIRPIAKTLSGVDLSSRMLEQAERRAIYDDLACAEITEFLSANEQQYDLIVAGDVFIYIGDLSKLFQLVARALAKGGLFCFSIEAEEKAEYALRPTGRYAHSHEYIRRLADDAGLQIKALHSCVIRKEAGVDVAGAIAVMRLP